MSLNYTPLRHKMLAAVSKHPIVIDPGDRHHFGAVRVSTISQMVRALNWLHEEAGAFRHELFQPGHLGYALTSGGRKLLSSWAADHGEPQ